MRKHPSAKVPYTDNAPLTWSASRPGRWRQIGSLSITEGELSQITNSAPLIRHLRQHSVRNLTL